MNRRDFLKSGVAMSVPATLPGSSDVKVSSEPSNGYRLLEEVGIFGNLDETVSSDGTVVPPSYLVRLEIREMTEEISGVMDQIKWLEGKLLVEPPVFRTPNHPYHDAFPIKTKSLDGLFRIKEDGTFRSNGPYRYEVS